jgi:hypothetical protein
MRHPYGGLGVGFRDGLNGSFEITGGDTNEFKDMFNK